MPPHSDRGQQNSHQLVRNPYQIQVTSNLYKLSLAENLIVYQYTLDVTPDEFWEADKVLQILRTKWSTIEKAIGPFIPAGKSILTTDALSESVEWHISFRGDNVRVRIDVDSCKQIYLNDEF